MQDKTANVIASIAPCRLTIYLAKLAPVAVVLRRGPSRWVRLSLWNIDTDTFSHGQWMQGRVYDRRCDLSPDGSLFVYFARKDGTRSAGIPQADSWVAISRPPWFTALALWTAGGTYHLGGYFVDGGHVCVGGWTDGPDQGSVPSWLSLTSDLPYVDRSPNWTERTVYFSRLRRDGWHTVDAVTWQHQNSRGDAKLIMMHESDSDFRAFGGPHVVRYAVLAETKSEEIPLGHATWADWDHRGRLILAREGKLVHWRSEGLEEEVLDFNSFVPEPTPSPRWAGTWPRPGDL
jgi:hypothetical protein